MAILIVVEAIRTISKGLEKRVGGTGNQRKNRDNSDHSSVKIS